MQEYGVGIFKAAATKSALKKLLKKGYISIDGRPGSTATWIKGGEVLTLEIEQQHKNQKTLRLALDVVYEDEFLAVVHKPAGILVSGNSFKTLARALPQNLIASSSPGACTPQPAHRLDYATTGAVLVGKTRESIRQLNQLFEDKAITKTYYAVTLGMMPTSGTINTPVDGKAAISVYTVVASVASPRFEQLNLVRLQPQTGRRHQLRKHLAGIGHPILGDRDYCPKELLLQGKGMYLHAFSLRFNHPQQLQPVAITTPLPQKFLKLFPNSNKDMLELHDTASGNENTETTPFKKPLK